MTVKNFNPISRHHGELSVTTLYNEADQPRVSITEQAARFENGSLQVPAYSACVFRFDAK